MNGRALAAVSGVGANAMRSKAEERAGEMTVANRSPEADFEDMEKTLVSDLVMGIGDLAVRLPHMSPSDAANALLDLLKKLAGDALDGAINIVADSLAGLAGIGSALLETLDQEIYIPLISAIYKWITGGSTLSFLDLICLALGLAAHVTSVILTGERFSTIAHGLGESLLPRPAAPHAAAQAFAAPAAFNSRAPETFQPIDVDPLPWGVADTKGAEVAYMVLQALNIGSVVATDLMFFEEARNNRPSKLRSFFKVMRGLTGYAANTILFVYSRPYYGHRGGAGVQRGQGTTR